MLTEVVQLKLPELKTLSRQNHSTFEPTPNQRFWEFAIYDEVRLKRLWEC